MDDYTRALILIKLKTAAVNLQLAAHCIESRLDHKALEYMNEALGNQKEVASQVVWGVR